MAEVMGSNGAGGVQGRWRRAGGREGGMSQVSSHGAG